MFAIFAIIKHREMNSFVLISLDICVSLFIESIRMKVLRAVFVLLCYIYEEKRVFFSQSRRQGSWPGGAASGGTLILFSTPEGTEARWSRSGVFTPPTE